MKKMLLLFICIFSFMISGCAQLVVAPVTAVAGTRLAAGGVKNPQTYYPQLTSAQYKKAAKIIAYRTDMGGVSSILTVKANGKNYGMMPTNSYFVIIQENFKKNNIELNITSNRTGTKSCKLNIDIKPGKIYYVKVDTVTLVGVGTILAEVVEKDDVPKKFVNVLDELNY